MPSWNDIQKRIIESPSAHDIVRRDYLQKLAKATGRNIIAYYSGWLGVKIWHRIKNMTPRGPVHQDWRSPCGVLLPLI